MIPKSKIANKLKIQILAGGISHERDISLKSARRVADALTEAGATVVIREPDEICSPTSKKISQMCFGRCCTGLRAKMARCATSWL